jgi:hypothetical protein
MPLLSPALYRELTVDYQHTVTQPRNYFTGGKLDPLKLPPYLRGLTFKPEEHSISAEEYNVFINECCVTPPSRDYFNSPDDIPGRAVDFEVSVDLSDKTPWQAGLRSMPPLDKLDIQDTLTRYLEQGLIEPSKSPYASTILPVRKDSGRHQLACVLTKLNERSVKNTYRLPLLKDNPDSLAGATFLSCVNITGAFFSMVIRPADRDYFAFITHSGLYRWFVIPYGYRNAGAHFCSLMDRTLADLKWQTLVTYMDDVLNYGGRTFGAHARCLMALFDRLQRASLRISIAKCLLVYLGLEVSRLGMRPAKKNATKIIEAVVESVVECQSFVGLCGFYRKWIQDYALLTAPIYTYIKYKTSWKKQEYQPAALESVAKLEHIVTEYPVLQHADFDLRFYVQTDASMLGFGVILMQLKPNSNMAVIAYASTTSPKSYGAFRGAKLEATGAVWATIYFRSYLITRQFTLLTDNVVLDWFRRKRGPETFLHFIVEA